MPPKGSPRPRLAARALRTVVAGLEALGHDSRAILTRAGFDPGELDDPDARLAPRAGARIWEQAMVVTGDGELGLHLAEAAPISAFDMHGYAILSSRTLRDAYKRACRYQHLINEGTELTYEEGDGVVGLRHARRDGGAVPRQPAEFLATAWVRLGRLVTGTTWRPRRVFFAHDRPSNIGEHQRVFGVSPHFASGQNAIQLDPTVVELTNERADPHLADLLDRYAASMPPRPVVATTAARVRQWLVEQHGNGAPVAGQAARALAMSERTLHRRLREEDTTYRQVLEGFRHETAVSLLAERRHSIAEVAFLLGYSEISAFYRAFRRWTGQSPAAFRDTMAE